VRERGRDRDRFDRDKKSQRNKERRDRRGRREPERESVVRRLVRARVRLCDVRGEFLCMWLCAFLGRSHSSHEHVGTLTNLSRLRRD